MSDEQAEWAGAREELRGLGDLVTSQIGGLRDQISGMSGELHSLGKTVAALKAAASRSPVGFEAMEQRQSQTEKRVTIIDHRFWGLVVGFLMLLAGIVVSLLK